MYKRYLDDTFILFRSSNHIIRLLNYLNSQNPLIKFSHTVEGDTYIPLMNFKVEKLDDTFKTGLFWNKL